MLGVHKPHGQLQINRADAVDLSVMRDVGAGEGMTYRHIVCTQCQTESWVQNLFDALRTFADGSVTTCAQCGSRCRIRLTFNFGVGAGPHTCYVVRAYIPDILDEWTTADGRRVAFYPFLVVTTPDPDGKGPYNAWLPYWHHVRADSGKSWRKYGQWAPFMKSAQLSQMLDRAKHDGLLD